MTSRINNQSGISLMLSVLLLAAITAISFSFITIVFIELRSSKDIVRSEPALYATLGVTEEALFQYKRYVNDRDTGLPVDPPLLNVPTCEPEDDYSQNPPIYYNVCNFGATLANGIQSGGVDVLPGSGPLTEDDPVRLETIYAGQTLVIPLYQVNDFTLQYGQLNLQRVPFNNPDRMLVSMRKISENPSIDDVIIDYGTLYENSVKNITDFENHFQYELILENTSFDNIQLSIASFGPNIQPKGLPFVGKKVLKVISSYLGLTRTYKVYIPVP